MLGWEYPPHINGGLGTACEGLTKALASLGASIHFVVPRAFGDEKTPHMHFVDAEYEDHLCTLPIPALLDPYTRCSAMKAHQDLMSRVHRYADDVLAVTSQLKFDLIHAHDWMTFPAAIAVKRARKVPLLSHVHSIEYDRSGEGAFKGIEDIEQAGMHASNRILAVSKYTKALVSTRYNISQEKIEVVHNGVEQQSERHTSDKRKREKVVLFLGRITFQKGPEYFVKAAEIVLRNVPEARFVMAGDGDQLPRMKELVKELNLEDVFSFPGFLKGDDVHRMYSKASVYVMPSVSEPFGIAPLEAIRQGTPVIISNQSGVSEVIDHALKVDFWNVEQLARYITGSLNFPELCNELVSHSTHEVKSINWLQTAKKVMELYNKSV